MAHRNFDRKLEDADDHRVIWSHVTTTVLSAVVIAICIYALANGGLNP